MEHYSRYQLRTANETCILAFLAAAGGWVPVPKFNWGVYTIPIVDRRLTIRLVSAGLIERKSGHGGADPQASQYRITDEGRRQIEERRQFIDGLAAWIDDAKKEGERYAAQHPS